MRPLHRSLLFTARPSRHLNCFFALSPSPSPSSSRSITYNASFDPEEMPGHADEEDIPFEHDLSPKLPASAPTQKVALAVPDSWAFLQGVPQKTNAYQVPYSRQIPRTGAFPPPRLPAQFADQRLQYEKDGAAGPLTEREREIFTRIFESILSERSTFTPRMPPIQSLPSTSLNALFESAVGPQQSGSEISFGPSDLIDKNSAAASLALASSFEQYPAALRAAAAKASGLINLSRTPQVDLRRSLSIMGLVEDLHMCQTDLALRQWMDDRVFCLIKDGRFQTSMPDYLPGSYAFLLAEGMKILRTTFNDFTGCLAIFERVKKFGAESYVMGCSVDVYNQAIAAKWEAYRDLYKIKELVDEMDINGVQGDKKTVRLIHDIMDDVAAMDYSKKNPVAHAMFTEGNEGMLSHLNYKADVWDVPETGAIEESLSMLA